MAFVVISPGRSGSSYVGSCLAKAGLFGGEMRKGDQWNEGGYFENIRLHSMLRQWYGSDWLGPFPDEKPGWHEAVSSVLDHEPWFFKGGAFYWKTFASFDPVYIKVWRDRDKILRSFRRCGFLQNRFSWQEIALIVDRQHEAMKEIPGLDVHI